jgi:hypothetical protein
VPPKKKVLKNVKVRDLSQHHRKVSMY